MLRSLLFSLVVCIFIMNFSNSVAASDGETINTPVDRQKLCKEYTSKEKQEEKQGDAIFTSLKIGYRTDAAPFSYMSKSGKAQGYIVDICRKIVEKITGNKPKDKDFIEVTSGSRFQALATEKIDLLCDSSTLTLEREACFDHTLLTFPSGPTLAHTLPEKEFEKTDVPRIGVLGDSSTYQRASEAKTTDALKSILNVDKIKLIKMNSYEKLFENIGPNKLAQEPIDFIFADREILLKRAKTTGKIVLRVNDNYMGYEPYTIYMGQNRDLRYLVNAALVNIYSTPEIHKLLTDNFDQLTDTIGQFILLQRIPAGKIYDPQ